MPALLCTVRGCRLPLARDGQRYVCANGHSFDLARSGYLNLLQPQDRKSAAPGDSASAVAARRRFYDRNLDAAIVDAIVRALPLAAGVPLLDVGCGDGHHLRAFSRAYGIAAHGVDLSIPAIELAVRRQRDATWIVANADRFIPWADASFPAITSITARLNPEEFRRLLAPGGRLLVVLPSPDDLIELRESVLGERVERDRSERTAGTFAPLFTLEHRASVRDVVRLDHDAIADVMSSSYRGIRSSQQKKLDRLDALDVTLGRDLLLFR